MASAASPALVGRDTQLPGAIAEPPSVIQVPGEVGIGRTRLVRADIDPLRKSGRIVVLGHRH
ncbi:hypothetical protein [Nonomuraea aurantiaca]|uniref:hypothetical protein n=1 Tax=Nonomuraea aurantiaca TaxID=2878562 RepID=UPI001CDA07CD|nr:hypothetical protein [Nonomuraea aurantiaca]MCA2221411.1 hypothetical protein [Nonomuraea aurantiaca]